jgi:alpha-galactosidase
VIAVNQRSRGNREVLAEGDRVVWAAEAEDSGATYVGLFNRGEQEELAVEVPLSRLGLGDTARARDLWKGQDLGTVRGVVRASVPSHGALLFRLAAR